MMTGILLAAEEAAHAAQKAGLPQLDSASWPSQLFWLALCFGVLYVLMANFFLPRIGAALEERRDRIADDLDKAAESKRMAEEAEKRFNRALADARAKSQGIAGEARDEARAEVDALRREADESAAAATKAAEARISALRATATTKVREAACDTTQAIVEALINETPTDPVVKAAVARAAGA